MGKQEKLTLHLDFPEGAESPDATNIRLKILRASGLLFDQGEQELVVSAETIGRISAVFAGSLFRLERRDNAYLIRKRESPNPVQAVVDEEREEPDYCDHFRKGEWGDFFESARKAVDIAMRVNAPKKDGSVPKWRVWFDRNKRVFQYRGEELLLFNGGKEVDEKTLKAWMKKINKNKRTREQRRLMRLEEEPAW